MCRTLFIYQAHDRIAGTYHVSKRFQSISSEMISDKEFQKEYYSEQNDCETRDN